LWSIPEVSEVWLVPDIDRKTISSMVVIHVRDKLCKIIVPTGPVSIVSRIWRSRILSSICTPEIMDEEDEIGVVLSGCPVIGNRRSKSNLSDI
jgi:hypothetical protein